MKLRNGKVCVKQQFVHRKFCAKKSVRYLQFATWHPCSSKKKDVRCAKKSLCSSQIGESCFQQLVKSAFSKKFFHKHHQFFVAKQRNYFVRSAQKHFCFFCWHFANMLLCNWSKLILARLDFYKLSNLKHLVSKKRCEDYIFATCKKANMKNATKIKFF